jgi:hypothetical protein
MSPWTSLSADRPTERALRAANDFITPPNTLQSARNFFASVPPSQRNYVDIQDDFPSNWFDGIHSKVVDRVLITVGDQEYMYEEAMRTSRAIPRAKLIVQKNGIHIDPLLDFLAGDRPKEMSYQIVDWLYEGFKE